MKIFITIGILLLTLQSMAQQDSTAVVDSTEPARSTFTIGATYANNADYYGQKSVEKMPYIAAAAVYHHKSGLFATAMAYRLLNDSQRVVSASALGLGFSRDLGKRFNLDISYSHTFYPALSPFLQAANANNASLGLTYTNWLAVSAEVDYAFGKTDDIFVTGGLTKLISLGSITSKDLVTLQPALKVTAGTQRFYETYVTEKSIRDSVLGIVPVPPIFGQPGTTPTTSTKVSSSFDLLSYNFKLPLAYNRAHYMVELAYQLSLLSERAQTGAGTVNSFISASFYYQF
jgi:hypothetical protein